MVAILPHPPEQTAFEPPTLEAVSRAFEEVCAALNIPSSKSHEREVIATRIIDLARTGVIDPKALRNRVLFEAKTED